MRFGATMLDPSRGASLIMKFAVFSDAGKTNDDLGLLDLLMSLCWPN